MFSPAPARIELLEPRQLFAANLAPDHIVVVIEEDRFVEAIGDTAHLPYVNQLAASGLVYTNSHGVAHPSLPDYLALYAGSTLGITDNGQGYNFSNANLAKSLNSKLLPNGQYRSFVGFAESLPRDGDTTTRISNDPTDPAGWPDLYMRNYNPMAMFTDAGSRNGVALTNAQVNKTFASFPTTTAGYAALPTVSYVIPNTKHNTHGSNEQSPWATDPANYNMFRTNADAWLKAKLDGYLQWAKTNNSLLIVTTDEEETDSNPSDSITTIVNGDTRLFVPGTNSTFVNHFNVLRTIEDMYGLPLLGTTGSAAGLTVNGLGQLSPFPVVSTGAATTTSVSTSGTPTVYGQSVTFSATVTSTGVPTGSVTFKDGGTTLGTATVNASGIATLATTVLSAAAHSITAVYTGDTAYAASTSAALNQTVNRATTGAWVTQSLTTSVYGQGVTFLAGVGVAAPGAGLATGLVTFFDGPSVLGTATLNAQGQASLTSFTLAAGSHSITASYGGDINFLSSLAPTTLNVAVSQASTTTTVTAPAPAVFGQSISFTVSVTPVSPGSGNPSGSVQFVVDGSSLGGPTALVNGIAISPATALLTIGSHTVWAVYAGDSNFTTSTSSAVSQAVNPAGATVNVTSSASPAAQGEAIAFFATVAPLAPGAGTPRGAVQFLVDFAVFGAAVPLFNGSATSPSIDTLGTGPHTITALYSGDANFTSANSANFVQSVGLVNDSFANRVTLSGTTLTVNGTNLGATKETGEPDHSGIAGGKSVWWTWTAPAAGAVTIDTLGSNFDTLLGVYTGTAVNALTTVASNNNDTGVLTSKVSFTAVAGRIYQIAVDGNAAASGSITLNVKQLPVAPGAPTGIVASDGTFSDKVGITWTAPAGATAFEVWRNTSSRTNSATKISAVDVSASSYDDTTAVAGKTYYYWVKAKNAGGTSGFSASNSGYRTVAATGNNNFANRTLLSGTLLTVTASSVGATKETGEPNHAGNSGGKSLWWTWTAPVAGTLTIDTIGSSFDTLLAVYTGTSVSALTQIAANDDSLAGGTTTSKLSFSAVAGTTYQIAVDGYGGLSGNITLNLKLG